MAFTLQGRRLQALAWERTCRHLGALVGASMPSSSSLWDIVKREQWEKHDSRHIADIWSEYHSNPQKHRVATVLPAAQYTLIAGRAAESPTFVLPAFRGPNAYENFMLQCQLRHVLLTSLEDFKRHGPSAVPHFSLTYYRELMDSKGLVLVRGDIMQPNALTALQASGLMRNIHEFYTKHNLYALLHKFNHRPDEFDFARVLEALGEDSSQFPADN